MKGSTIISAAVMAIALIDEVAAGRLPSAKSLMNQHQEDFNSYPKNGTITVTGTGRVDVFSDLTKIRFAIYKSEKCDLSKPQKECEAAKATQRLNDVSAAVVGALTDDDDVVGVYTEGQDFFQEKEFYTDEQVEAIANAACAPCPSFLYRGESKEYLSQYKANAEFIAIVQTSEQGRLLDLIVQSGANVITDISTYIAPDVMNQANIDAVTAGAQDALDQATAVIDQLPEGPIEAAVTYTEQIDIPFNGDSFSSIAANVEDRKPVFDSEGTITASYTTVGYQVEVRLFFAD